ncbi:hypothetical protein ACQ86G_21670 [Roseateles chitinivorans]|uniref:hypothetical protein n=1 Tax=Roseateles chitinivorans TaxID=2917965 RepID=UPI003D67D30C
MNRWQAWAGRLRARHGRVDAWRAAGAMALRRGAGAGASGTVVQVHAGPVVHQHLRLAVTARFPLSLRAQPSTPMVLRQPMPASASRTPAEIPRMTVAGAGPDGRPGRPGPAGPDGAPGHPGAMASVPLTHRAAAPLFVRAGEASARPMLAASPSAPVLRAAVQSIAPVAAAHAAEIATRLRRGATREELPPPPSAAVLAAPGRAAARAAEAQAPVTAQAARQQPSAPRPAPAAPAVDVDALTGLVIQQIDRRLVAWRERMGRV